MKFAKSNTIYAQRFWLTCIILLFFGVSRASDSFDSDFYSDELLSILSDSKGSEHNLQPLANSRTRILHAESRQKHSDSEEEISQSNESSSSDESEDSFESPLERQIYNRLISMSGENELSAGSDSSEDLKKAEKKMEKAKEESKKAKEMVKKYEGKLRRFKQHSEQPPAPHEEGLTHDLLTRDLTEIPRKTLLKMAKSCKLRKKQYAWEKGNCEKHESDDLRKACMEVFEKTKGQIESQCGDLKEIFTRIFKFISDLRDWSRSRRKSSSSGKKLDKEKGAQRFLDLADDVKKSKDFSEHEETDTKKKIAKIIKADKKNKKEITKLVKKAVEKVEAKKATSKEAIKKEIKKEAKKEAEKKVVKKELKDMIKKEAKQATKGSKTKKIVKSLEKTLKKGIKEAKNTKQAGKYLKTIEKKLKKKIAKDEEEGKGDRVEKTLLKKVQKTKKKVKKSLKQKAKGCKGMKKMIEKLEDKKTKGKRRERFKKELNELAKKAGDSSDSSESPSDNSRVRFIKKIMKAEEEKEKKDEKKKEKKEEKKEMKKVLKKLDQKENREKKKQDKFLKKLIKREQSKPTPEEHREAGKTFTDWLRMKEGSNEKMRNWVENITKKTEVKAEEKKEGPRTKVEKKQMEKCMYRKDYKYGGEKMGTPSKQEKVEGCCDKCRETSGCRAWSWDRTSKECTLIKKVDKTGESDTCCIAGRRKSKLVQTSKDEAKDLKKGMDKRIDKMEIKPDLTGKQKEMVKDLKECKQSTKDFVEKKKECAKNKGNKDSKECFRKLKDLEKKVKKCKDVKKKADKLNKKVTKDKEKKEEKKEEEKEKKDKDKAKKKVKKETKKAEEKAKEVKKEAAKKINEMKKEVKKEEKKVLKKMMKEEKKKLKDVKKKADKEKKAVKKELKKELKDMKKDAKKVTKEIKKEEKKVVEKAKAEAKEYQKMSKKVVKEAKKDAAKKVKDVKKETKEQVKAEVKQLKKEVKKAEKKKEEAEEKKEEAKKEKDEAKKEAKEAKKEAKAEGAKSEGAKSAEEKKEDAKKEEAKEEEKKDKEDAEKAAKKVEKSEKDGKTLEKEIKKQSAKAGGMTNWLNGESTKGAPKGEAKEEVKKALKKIEKEEAKAIKKAGLDDKESKGDDPNGFEVKKNAKGAKKDSGADDGAMEMTRSGSKSSGGSGGSSDGGSDCEKCNKNKEGGASGGSGGAGSGGSGGSGSGGSGGVYDYFKQGGKQKNTEEFGFHRSKMKNYNKGRYGEDSAVASSPESDDASDWTTQWGEDTAVASAFGTGKTSDDWTDFRFRRNLEEWDLGGLLDDGDDALETGGRQEKKEGSSDELKGTSKREIKKQLKKVKKAIKKKLKEGKSSRDTSYDEPKNLGSLVVRNVDDPEKTKMRIAKLESQLEELNDKIKEHRKDMIKHFKNKEKIGSDDGQFKSLNSELTKERERVMRRMKKKYKKLKAEESKRRAQNENYENRIRDLEGAFKAFKMDMTNKMHEKQSSDIMKRLDKIQENFQEQKMKKKAMRYVDKMAENVKEKEETDDPSTETKPTPAMVQIDNDGDQDVNNMIKEDQKLLDKVDNMASGISKKGIAEGWAWDNERTQKDDDVFNYFKGKPIPDSAKDFGFQNQDSGSQNEAKPRDMAESSDKAESKPLTSSDNESSSAPNTGSSDAKVEFLEKKAKTFAKSTAKLLTGEFKQHDCRKRVRKCQQRLDRHLKILRECEKSKEGDSAPCWEEVKQTNELVMNDYERCRKLRKSCSSADDSGEDEDADPCSGLSKSDPKREVKCLRLKMEAEKSQKKGGNKFSDRIASEVKDMTQAFEKEAEAIDGLKHRDNAYHNEQSYPNEQSYHNDQSSTTTSTTTTATTTMTTTTSPLNSTSASSDDDVVTKGKQIIIKGGVQHFYLHPAGAKDDKKQNSDDVDFDGPKIDIGDEKTNLDDPYLSSTSKLMNDKHLVKNYTGEELSKTELQDLYDFFKSDASTKGVVPEPVEDYNKPYGFNVDTSKRASNNGVFGWVGKKYRQISQFFGRRALSTDSSDVLTADADSTLFET